MARAALRQVEPPLHAGRVEGRHQRVRGPAERVEAAQEARERLRQQPLVEGLDLPVGSVVRRLGDGARERLAGVEDQHVVLPDGGARDERLPGRRGAVLVGLLHRGARRHQARHHAVVVGQQRAAGGARQGGHGRVHEVGGHRRRHAQERLGVGPARRGLALEEEVGEPVPQVGAVSLQATQHDHLADVAQQSVALVGIVGVQAGQERVHELSRALWIQPAGR